MRPSLVLAALALSAAPLAAQPLAAQPLAAPAPTAAPRVGLLAGLNSATLTGEAFSDDGGAIDRRNGFVGGVSLTLPLRGAGLAFRPELLYAQKGASASVALVEDGSAFDLRGTVALSYLELPLLVQYTVPTAGGLRPHLYAGPALALRTACRVRLRASFDGMSASESAACDDGGGAGGALDAEPADVRRFDAGGVVGGALAFAVGGRVLAVGARYTHGFVRLSDIADAPRNRAVAVYGSVELPVARRGR